MKKLIVLILVIIFIGLFLISYGIGVISIAETWTPWSDNPTPEPLPDKNVMVSKNGVIEVQNSWIQEPSQVSNDQIVLENKSISPSPITVDESDEWSIRVEVKLRLYYVRNPYITHLGSLSGGEIYSRDVGPWYTNIFTYTPTGETFLIEIWLLGKVYITKKPVGVFKFTVYIGKRPVRYNPYTIVVRWNVFKLGEGKHIFTFPIKVIYEKEGVNYVHYFSKTFVIEFTLFKVGQFEYQKMTNSGWVTAYKPIYDIRGIKTYAAETYK